MKRAASKVFGTQGSVGKTLKYKAGIWGIGSVAYSHSAGSSVGANASAPITFYSSTNDVTTYRPLKSPTISQTENDAGVNINIAALQISASFENLVGEFVGVGLGTSIGDFGLNANVHYNRADWSVGVSLGISRTNNGVDMVDEISLDIGGLSIIGAAIGAAVGCAGVVGKIASAIFMA